MAWKVSLSPVKEKALAKGVENPSQLAKCAHISRHTAKRWWDDDPTMRYIDKPTLAAIAECLDCTADDLILMVKS
jgi:hypothetical protein